MPSVLFLRERNEVERGDADREASFRTVGGLRSPLPNRPCAGGLPDSSPHLFDWLRKRSALQAANAAKRRAANRRSPIHICLRHRRATVPLREVTAPDPRSLIGRKCVPREQFPP